MASRVRLVLVLIVITAACAVPALAGPRDLVVVRPGGPSASEEANDQVARLIKGLGKKAGWDEANVSAVYFNREKPALEVLRTNPPGFLIATPGFYLEHRDEFGLVPVNQALVDGKSASRYAIVVKTDTIADLDGLKGKTIAGSPLYESAFVERIVLQGKFVFGADITAEESRALSALRKVAKGELDAAILDETEAASMPNLPFARHLEIIWRSEPVPNTGLFQLKDVAAPDDVKALAQAATGFCDEGEGASVCQTYGITGFQDAPARVFDALIEMYAARPTAPGTEEQP